MVVITYMAKLAKDENTIMGRDVICRKDMPCCRKFKGVKAG